MKGRLNLFIALIPFLTVTHCSSAKQNIDFDSFENNRVQEAIFVYADKAYNSYEITICGQLQITLKHEVTDLGLSVVPSDVLPTYLLNDISEYAYDISDSYKSFITVDDSETRYSFDFLFNRSIFLNETLEILNSLKDNKFIYCAIPSRAPGVEGWSGGITIEGTSESDKLKDALTAFDIFDANWNTDCSDIYVCLKKEVNWTTQFTYQDIFTSMSEQVFEYIPTQLLTVVEDTEILEAFDGRTVLLTHLTPSLSAERVFAIFKILRYNDGVYYAFAR